MTTNELKEKLSKVIPAEHPVWQILEGFDGLKKATDIQDLVRATQSLTDSLDDWKRGIRDWSEVEASLNLTRAELALYEEA